MKVLQDHKEKFGVDFAKNKQALNDTCKISSKSLKNKLQPNTNKKHNSKDDAKITSDVSKLLWIV